MVPPLAAFMEADNLIPVTAWLLIRAPAELIKAVVECAPFAILSLEYVSCICMFDSMFGSMFASMFASCV